MQTWRMSFHDFRVWVRLSFTNGRGLEKAWRAALLGDPCVYCGGQAENLDHILPASRKGADDWENRAPTCTDCNSRRGNVSLALWLAALHATNGSAVEAKRLCDHWRHNFAVSVGVSFVR